MFFLRWIPVKKITSNEMIFGWHDFSNSLEAHNCPRPKLTARGSRGHRFWLLIVLSTEKIPPSQHRNHNYYTRGLWQCVLPTDFNLQLHIFLQTLIAREFNMKNQAFILFYGNCDQVMIVVTTCPRHRSRIIKIHIGVEIAYRQIDKIMIELFKVIS